VVVAVKGKASERRSLTTRSGTLRFPAYIPVTTFGKKYPLDDLVRPFLARLAPAVMVSHYYARQATERVGIPMLVDSGGFASLFEWASIEEQSGLGVIRLRGTEDEETITPDAVLGFQEEIADVAFTLDFPIPPARADQEGERRLQLTIANALWAIRNRRRRDLPLYACVQGWDVESYRRCAAAYVDQPFDGIAIGGLVPRMRDRDLVESIVTAVRELIPGKPLHVFGLGQPNLVKRLFELGVDSVDSSAYVRLAAEGKGWGQNASSATPDLSPLRRMHLAIANLAVASQRALPLGFAQILFSSATDRQV
jgi:tRNA-guanine family transglycosylase